MSGKPTISRKVSARIPIAGAEYQLILYQADQDEKEHLALVLGQVTGKTGILTRLHSECFTGDVLGSRRCDCGEQLQEALNRIQQEGEGIVIYLRQEGRGIGLLDKLRAYNLQDEGYDTVEANLLLGHQPDERNYSVAASIVEDLGVQSVRLLTNNPVKIASLAEQGAVIDERIPMNSTVYPDNAAYLLTKVHRMQHLLELDLVSSPSHKGKNGNNEAV
jgi:GTP cyclohydrolase II